MSSTTLPGTSDLTAIDKLRAGPPTVVYDGACPFCTAYSKLVQLRGSVGPARLLNARDLDPALLTALERRYNLDEGMLFVHDGTIYHGNDAVYHIALLSSDSTFLRRLSAWALSKPRVAVALYPLLRLGRNSAIWLRGAGRIHP